MSARRKASYCIRGQRISCGQRHKEADACLGRPLCGDCYDYDAAVVWNVQSGELWRHTIIALRRQLDKAAKVHGARVRLSYAKVAEFQRRGLIHFHRELMARMGHSTTRAALIYLHNSDERQRKIAEGVDEISPWPSGVWPTAVGDTTGWFIWHGSGTAGR